MPRVDLSRTPQILALAKYPRHLRVEVAGILFGVKYGFLDTDLCHDDTGDSWMTDYGLLEIYDYEQEKWINVDDINLETGEYDEQDG